MWGKKSISSRNSEDLRVLQNKLPNKKTPTKILLKRIQHERVTFGKKFRAAWSYSGCKSVVTIEVVLFC